MGSGVEHNCDDLTSCCDDLSGNDQAACNQVLGFANETACDSAYDVYCGGAMSSGHTCAELAPCCEMQSGAAQDLCNQAVEAGSEPACDFAYTNLCQ
jgi:hypothetical protein